MPWAIGQDELPDRSGEVAVRDVDGDALLTLGPQAVGEQSKIGSIQTLALAYPLNMIKSVDQHGVGVEKESTHQSRFAIINRARRSEPQQCPATGDGVCTPGQECGGLGHQK